MENECCGSCTYSEYDREEGQWGCVNPESEGYGLLTAYDDGCEEWEEKS